MTHPSRRLGDETLARLLVGTDPYLSCDDCFARIDEYVEQRLTHPDQVDLAMEAHLAGCGACAEEAAALSELLGPDVP